MNAILNPCPYKVPEKVVKQKPLLIKHPQRPIPHFTVKKDVCWCSQKTLKSIIYFQQHGKFDVIEILLTRTIQRRHALFLLMLMTITQWDKYVIQKYLLGMILL